MDQLSFAAAMESGIRQEIEYIGREAPPELKPFLDIVGKFQVEFELLLDRGQCTNIDTGCYPEVDPLVLLGTDSQWQELTRVFGQVAEKSTADLTALWMIQALIEKSGQLYQQASINSAYPATRLFMRSMTEAKSMLRRRIDGLLRVLYNEMWADLGFAPLVLGKD